MSVCLLHPHIQNWPIEADHAVREAALAFSPTDTDLLISGCKSASAGSAIVIWNLTCKSPVSLLSLLATLKATLLLFDYFIPVYIFSIQLPSVKLIFPHVGKIPLQSGIHYSMNLHHMSIPLRSSRKTPKGFSNTRRCIASDIPPSRHPFRCSMSTRKSRRSLLLHGKCCDRGVGEKARLRCFRRRWGYGL
jgi:hypothetical protein